MRSDDGVFFSVNLQWFIFDRNRGTYTSIGAYVSLTYYGCIGLLADEKLKAALLYTRLAGTRE